MPIVKCAASKATPAKGLNYIMDPEKALASGSLGFRSDDPEKMAQQMIQTMHVHGKGWNQDERKYYHCKVSFDPRDLKSEGGILDETLANRYAEKMAQKLWPGREVAWSVQHHGTAMHIHFIIGACEMATGKKLDARNSDYRKWKDYSQELAKEMNLSTLDWRKATKEKREREIQSENAVDETFAEQGLMARGKASWKDELRNHIDDALRESSSMDDFREKLKEKGIVLTRCTEKTISYKLGDHQACRGDSLGGDYTAAAIRNALEHNVEPEQEEKPAAAPVKKSLGSQIGNAAARAGDQENYAAAMNDTRNRKENRVISKEERQFYREFGRLAGVKRSEVDALCDRADKATWAEKQEVWAECNQTITDYWAEYNARQSLLKDQKDEAYRKLRKLNDAKWALDPRNRRRSLFGGLYALIVIAKSDSRFMIEHELFQLKKAQEDLRRSRDEFKSTSGAAKDTLKQRDLPLETYMEGVKKMQKIAREIQMKDAPLLDPKAFQAEVQARKQTQTRKNTYTR